MLPVGYLQPARSWRSCVDAGRVAVSRARTARNLPLPIQPIYLEHMNRVDALAPEIYAAFDRIKPMPADLRPQLRSALSVRTVDRGEHLVSVGDPCDFIAYMCSGWLRYFYVDELGKEFTRYFCTAGHFVAPHGTDEGSSYCIVAVEDAQLLVIPRAKFEHLLDVHPYWGRVVFAVSEFALGLAEKRERTLVLRNATERYFDLLNDFPGIENHVRQLDIASYLGITPEALSRIRGQKAPFVRPKN